MPGKASATKANASRPIRESASFDRKGKPSALYLYTKDATYIRHLSAWLAMKGKRVNDSLVVRTALRAAQPGPALLNAYEEAIGCDQRTRKRPA